VIALCVGFLCMEHFTIEYLKQPILVAVSRFEWAIFSLGSVLIVGAILAWLGYRLVACVRNYMNRKQS